jgi:hypothetical protein
LPSKESLLEAPLDAQDASYFAASARMASLRVSFIGTAAGVRIAAGLAERLVAGADNEPALDCCIDILLIITPV